MENEIRLLMISVMGIVLLCFGIYIAVGMVLFKASKVKFGKYNYLAWVPLLNIYLIGKIHSSSMMGIFLLVSYILTCEYVVMDGNIRRTFGLINISYRSYFNYAIIFIIILMFVRIAISLRNKKDKNNN